MFGFRFGKTVLVALVLMNHQRPLLVDMINDEFVISRRKPFFVIPLAKAGIQYYYEVKNFWTPVFTGVTTFY